MEYWACVVTKPNSEHIAVENLERQRFEVFMPKIKVKKLRRKQLCSIIEPLFRRYIFVMVKDQWSTIRNTIGVSNIVLDGEKPAIVGDNIIRSIRAREVGGYVTLQEPQKFKTGQKIKIIGSAFDGYQGIFQEVSGEDRIKALLDLLGQKIVVSLSEKNIVAA